MPPTKDDVDKALTDLNHLGQALNSLDVLSATLLNRHHDLELLLLTLRKELK